MKKDKTISVNVCDFCIDEARTTWQCAHCEKDACSKCGRDWSLYADLPREQDAALLHVATFIVGRGEARFTAFICHECSKNELGTALLRFGFQQSNKQQNEQAA